MKYQFIIFLIISGALFSCKNEAANGTAKESVKAATDQMIIPDSPDTILSNGRKNIFLVSRRELPGLFVERAIFPPGYRSNAHMHPVDLNITVIRGSINLAFTNEKDSSMDVQVYGPGSFIRIPAGQPHFEWFTDTSMMDITGVGPMNTVNLPIIHSTN